MFGVSTSEGSVIPKLLNSVLLASLCLRNTSFTAGGTSKTLKKMLTMCYHASIMYFTKRACCCDSVTQHWASVWNFVLKCIGKFWVHLRLFSWSPDFYFPLLFQSHAKNVLHNVLLQSVHHHETDRKQVTSPSWCCLVVLTIRTCPKIAIILQAMTSWIYIYIYIASLYDLIWKLLMTST